MLLAWRLHYNTDVFTIRYHESNRTLRRHTCTGEVAGAIGLMDEDGDTAAENNVLNYVTTDLCGGTRGRSARAAGPADRHVAVRGGGLDGDRLGAERRVQGEERDARLLRAVAARGGGAAVAVAVQRPVV